MNTPHTSGTAAKPCLIHPHRSHLRPLRRSRRIDRLCHKGELQGLPAVPPRQRIAHCFVAATSVTARNG